MVPARALIVVAALGLAGCGSNARDRVLEEDCFGKSKGRTPSQKEVEGFASVALPPEITNFRATCQGFMDRFVQARFTMPVDDVDDFLAESRFRRVKGLPINISDEAGFINRRLIIELRDPRTVSVEVDAFEA